MRSYRVFFDVEVYVTVEAGDAATAAERAEDQVARELGSNGLKFKRVEITADDGGVDEVVL